MTMMPWLQNPNASKGPGIGEQFAKKAATNLAAKEAAKLGLGAAGTAVGGPLGGAAGTALGELAGPLAGQLVGSLFNKGGVVHADAGKFIDAARPSWRDDSRSNRWADYQATIAKLIAQRKAAALAAQTPEAPVVEAPAEPAAEEYKAPDRAVGGKSSGGSGSWNIPLGNIFGADISTQGDYASGTNYDDGTKGDDAWNAGLKATWSFDKGGNVPAKGSIWDKVKSAASYAWKNENKPGDRYAKNNPQVTKPAYKAIGGMTSGPLGMSDALKAGKDKDISKVKIKKNKGDMSEEVEFNYHAPLAPKPTGE